MCMNLGRKNTIWRAETAGITQEVSPYGWNEISTYSNYVTIFFNKNLYWPKMWFILVALANHSSSLFSLPPKFKQEETQEREGN